ncbi:MAG: DotG/IcmE/VirB10 family protein [Alphaproteobacteria bacterium]|nr:DotG/IcmE/VirB10 family protein [Alphaproteobacteria bacterium]MDE2337066.1 DotG/IcmE/VirB10 family protein [Alphaproteobacteria bacterium]
MIDDDLDAPEDFEKEAAAEKLSLREIWDNNPALKIVAIVLAVAVLLGGYLVFFGKTDMAAKSVIGMNEVASAKQVPGKQIVDPAYRKALEEVNKQKAQQAAQTGGSAIPLPIAVSKGTGLQVPQTPQAPQSDVLAEWRRVADEEQMKAAQKKIQMESAPPPPAVPVVKPIRPQMVIKANPEEAKLLEQQMRVILKAQEPLKPELTQVTTEPSDYEKMKAQEAADKQKAQAASGAAASGAAGTADNGTGDKTPAKVIVAAGSVAYAQLLDKLDSDIPGPALVQVLSGPFAGGRLIGSIKMEDDYIVINFKTAVKDTVSYKIDAVALDENTTLVGQATNVNHHYIAKVVLPAASAFLTGYASAESQPSQQQTATSGVGTQTTTSQSTTRQSIFKGFESASQSVGNVLNQVANEPTTVIIAKGTTMGIFFTQTVTTKDAE